MSFDLFSPRSSFGGKKANNLVGQLKRYVSIVTSDFSLPAHVVFASYSRDRGDGGTEPVFDDHDRLSGYDVSINTSCLFDAKNREDLDDAFVALLVACGHELHHIAQFENMTPDLAACLIADMGNKRNYVDDSINYRRNIREIPCEYNGVLFAGDYIDKNFPEITDRDERLLRYLNKRGSDPSYIIRTPGCEAWLSQQRGYLPRPTTQSDKDMIEKEPFPSLEYAMLQFGYAELDAWNHGRKYHSVVRPACRDAYVQATKIGRPGNEGRIWDPIRTMFDDTKNAKDANRMLAAISLYHDPGLACYGLGVDISDLTIENVFGCPVPTVERMVGDLSADHSRQGQMPRTIADMQRQEAEAQKKFEADVERWTQYYRDREKQADETPVDPESVTEPSEPRPSEVLQSKLAEFNAKHAADQERKEKDGSKGYGE